MSPRDRAPAEEPPRRPKASRHDTRAGRARLLITAGLPWLGSQPIAATAAAVTFRDPASGQAHAVDRAALAAGTRALKRLLGEHRAALPEVVGDVRAWQAGVEAGLAVAKRAIHDGERDLPWWPASHPAPLARRARALAEAAPALAATIGALGWVRAAAPAALPTDLRWLERHRAALTELARHVADLPAVTLALRRLAALDGDRLVDPLLAVVGTAAVHEVPTEARDVWNACGERLANADATRVIELPKARLGPIVLAWATALAARPELERRRALRALAVLRLDACAAAWAATWTDLAPVLERLARKRPLSWDEVRTLRARVTRVAAAAPRALAPHEVGALLAGPLHDDLIALVARLPDGGAVTLPAEALIGLHDEVTVASSARWLGALVEGALGALGVDGWPRLWRDVLARTYLAEPARRLPQRAQAIKLGQVMARLLLEDREDVDAVARQAEVLAATGDVEGTLARLAVVRAAVGLPWEEGVTVALALGPTLPTFAAVATALAHRPDEDLVAAVGALAAALGPGGADVLRALVVADDRARLARAAARLVLAKAWRLPAPALPPQPRASASDDHVRYPAELRPALAVLDALAAGATAAAILDETFPPPDATRRELAAIEARLAAGHGGDRLARRAANLRARLTTPPPTTPARLARLTARLELAIATTRFDRWHAALAVAVDAAIADGFALATAAPPWLFDPRYRKVLAGLVDLDGDIRRLARELLVARTGPPPWDLRDRPWNRRWLTRMAARGVDLGPWLDGIGPRAAGTGVGRLTLTLEDDPLEVLRMGEHYRTCLSPGDVNYFAAVVNAADVNKRVIYGRTDDGQVLARCLIGLTDTGGIVTFNCYSHGRLGTATEVAAFIAELAARMGAVVVPRGEIRPLATGRWYDDGPRDLTGAYGFLADASPFRTQLATIAHDALLEHLRAAFAPLPLSGLVLSLVLPLPEVQARPSLIEPMLAILERSDDVPRATLLQAVRLAERAGLADRLGVRCVDALLAGGAELILEDDAVEWLATRAPQRLLATLRAARRRVASWCLPWWTYAMGRGLEAVHRASRATALYREVLDASIGEPLRTRCATRLQALGR